MVRFNCLFLVFFLQFMHTSLLFMALHSYLTAYQTPLAIALRKFYFAVLSKSTKWKHFHPNISNRNGLNFEFSLVEFVAFITHWWRKLRMLSNLYRLRAKLICKCIQFFWTHILLGTLSSIYQVKAFSSTKFRCVVTMKHHAHCT